MDLSTLNEMLGKTSEAWCAAASREPGHDTEGISATAGLRFADAREKLEDWRRH